MLIPYLETGDKWCTTGASRFSVFINDLEELKKVGLQDILLR